MVTAATGVSFGGEDRLTCFLRADLGTEEVEGVDSMLRFSFLWNEDTLSGAVNVMATDELGFPLALSHWAELTRAAAP